MQDYYANLVGVQLERNMDTQTKLPEASAADLSQTVSRLQGLVCHLLSKNERLRRQVQKEEFKSMRDSTDCVDTRQQDGNSAKRAARVFVIDDEPLIALTLAQMLLEQGYCTLWFSNPLDALAAIALRPPDLMITDVTMPQLCGVDLAIHVKETQPACAILLVSARAPYEDLAPAREQGHSFRILDKPIAPSHLLAEVRNLLPEGRRSWSAEL
jgi:CheY-like chemotaxis protein